MEKFANLEVYDLILTTSSPLFVGDGRNIIKKNYINKGSNDKVYIFDEDKFFKLLIKRNLIDLYESFIMTPGGDLYRFLRDECHLSDDEWMDCVRYKLDSSVFKNSKYGIRDINTIVRDAYGRVYIPGSSVKGALVTSILSSLILNEKDKSNREFDRKKFNEILFTRYLHKLKFDERKPQNAVNSLLRGIQISDSEPVDDSNIILTLKMDAGVSGNFSDLSGVLCRESIKPGTDIHLKMTIDRSIFKDTFSKEEIIKIIDDFDAYYYDTYLMQFCEPEYEADLRYRNSLFLSGGAGFFSKTLAYQYLGHDKALKEISAYMERTFRDHHHDSDMELGISPHTLEYTNYKGKYYPMGVCKVTLK